MRSNFTILIALLAIAGCGKGASQSSGSSTTASSGAVDCVSCSPAASCVNEACSCPANFMPPEPMFSQVIVRKDVAQFPGLITGVGLVPRADDTDALLVAFDPAALPVGQDIDLATAKTDAVRVGFGFDVVALMTVKGGYVATAGTLNLSSVCDTGVSGVLSNVACAEVDLFNDFAPIPGGCALAVPSVTFSIGSCDADGGTQ